MLSHRLYYNLKPYLPRRIRLFARRLLAKHRRQLHADTWPIQRFANQRPANWPGWPGGKQFALVLTHDVESPLGLARCCKLMTIEDRLGLRSSFNFIPGGSYQVSPELRGALVERGFEVGVHDLMHDGHLFQSRPEFLRHAQQINRYLAAWGAVGFRAGFMLRNLEWLHHLEIAYDSSTFDTDPFEPQPDGVNTIFPFWVPPPAAGPGSGYVELPYTLPQDFTLFVLLGERSPALWKSKVDWIAENGGMVLLDSHPDYMALGSRPSSSFEYPAPFYEDLLHYIKEKYAGAYWHALPAQVAAHVVGANSSATRSSAAV